MVVTAGWLRMSSAIDYLRDYFHLHQDSWQAGLSFSQVHNSNNLTAYLLTLLISQLIAMQH